MSTTTKPHIRIISGRPVTVGQPETKLQIACRRHGRPFGVVWQTGEGPRYWTVERIARLAAANEEDRGRRRNRAAL